MKSSFRIFALSAFIAVVATSCYIPPGTVRITGGSGKSIMAGSSDVEGETALQTTINLKNINLLPDAPVGTTFGKINFHDFGSGLNMQGTVLALSSDDTVPETPGVAASCEGRAQYGDGEWFPVQFVLTMTQNPVDVPGETKEEGRHAVFCIATGAGFSEGTYLAFGIYEGGNFVFHGAKGVIAR